MKIINWIKGLEWEGIVMACLVILAVSFVVFLGFMAIVQYKNDESVKYPTAYKAWVKMTGNTNNLSYAEWRSLVDVSQKQDSSSVVPIFIFSSH